MKKTLIRTAAVALAILTISSSSAFAGLGQLPHLSSHAFHPQRAADQPYIFDDGYRVYNTNSSSQNVVADGGIVTLAAGVTSYSATIYGSRTSGTGSLLCYVTLTNIASGVQYNNSASTAGVGAVSLTVTVPSLPSSTELAVGILCGVPGGNTYLYGVKG